MTAITFNIIHLGRFPPEELVIPNIPPGITTASSIFSGLLVA